VKLKDFGLSFRMFVKGNQQGKDCVNPRWSAPEVLRSVSQCTTQTDVFPFGVILWELLQQGEPWQDLRFNYQIEAALLKGQRPVIPSVITKLYKIQYTQHTQHTQHIQHIHQSLHRTLATSHFPYALSMLNTTKNTFYKSTVTF